MSKEIVITHSPSDPGQKGTGVVQAAIKRLERTYKYVEYVEIRGYSNSYAVKKKQDGHIFIDQMGKNHILGYNSIEAAAYGCAVVTDKREDTDNPAIHAEPTTLFEVLEGLVTDPNKIIANGMEMRDWVVQRHGYERVYNLLEPYLDIIVREGYK